MKQNIKLMLIITLSLFAVFFIIYFNQMGFPLWQFFVAIGIFLLLVLGIIVTNKLNKIKNLLEKQIEQNEKIISTKNNKD